MLRNTALLMSILLIFNISATRLSADTTVSPKAAAEGVFP